MSTNRKSTTRIELVETHNIALSLMRLHESSPFDGRRWKRALYHALTMSHPANEYERQKIREALSLP